MAQSKRFIPKKSAARQLVQAADPVTCVKARRSKALPHMDRRSAWGAHAPVEPMQISDGLWVHVDLLATVSPQRRHLWHRQFQHYLTPFKLAVLTRGDLLMIWALEQALDDRRQELAIQWIRAQAEFMSLRIQTGRPQRWRQAGRP